MLTRDNLHEYQTVAVNHMNAHHNSMLWLGMGLGKTVSALTSIVDRIAAGQVKKVLIFGPIRVINSVWAQEARKWEHTKHLKFSVIHGTPQKRGRAMFADADIHLVNYESANWLCEQLLHYYISQGKPLPYDMIVYDEVSKMKNSTSKRFAGGKTDKVDGNGKEYTVKLQGWRKMLPHFPYTVGLTGTPASNGYLDLFGQFLAVDGGERLGEYVTHFKSSYFQSDYMGWSQEVTNIGKQCIEKKISDITLKMDAKDYLDLPAVKVVNMMVDLPAKARKAYEEMEANMFAALDNGTELEVFSKTAISNKCLQFCNGSPYLHAETSEYEALHDAKLNALEEVLEEAGGSPVLCSYTYKADAERIMKKFKAYKPVNLTAEKASDTAKILTRWKEGEIKLLIGHPMSMSHGIDGLQVSGYIMVWFGLNWSLELYDQMNARIDRQGQTHPVSIIRILCRDTIDLAVADALERKTDSQEGLKSALQRYKQGITTNDLDVNFF
jgi:SNF2 family DNA or RNA helicase